MKKERDERMIVHGLEMKERTRREKDEMSCTCK